MSIVNIKDNKIQYLESGMIDTQKSQRNISPLGKDLNLIGKLVAKPQENPEQMDSPISAFKNPSVNIGINTSRLVKFAHEHEGFKPITHFKMNSSVYKVNLNQSSQEITRSSNKKLPVHEERTIPDKRNKSPIGSIHKQNVRQRSVPVSPRVTQLVSKQVGTPQLPSINKVETNVKGLKSAIGKNNQQKKLCYSQRHTPKNSVQIGKTYTSSMFSRKYDPDEQQSLQHPRKGSKIENNSLKLPPFINEEQQRQKKQFQQQTRLNQNVQKNQPIFKDDEDDKYEEENLQNSNIHGFIYNRNPYTENNISIDLRTPISRIKQLLVEGENEMFISFMIPQILFIAPSPESTSQELHMMMIQAFGHLDISPQIVSIKKYANCVMMREKKLCILWNFNGKIYFGGWNRPGMQGQGNKHGIGLEWAPARYIYYGQFEDNKKNGYGIMKKSNKEAYVGCWKNNQRNGWGKVYDSLGRLVQNGEFMDGCLVILKRQNF